MRSAPSICAAAAAGLTLFGGTALHAQKKPAPACTPESVSSVTLVRTIAGASGEGFGHRPRATVVSIGEESRLIVAVPNRNEKVYLYNLDPATGAGSPLDPVDGVVVESSDPRRTFFPQYSSATADFDGNGVGDFAFSNSNPGMVYVLMGYVAESTLSYERHLVTTPAGANALSWGAGMAAGDLDAPADSPRAAELVVTDGTRFDVYRWNGSGFGLASTIAPTLGAGESFGGFGFSIADVTGDFLPDIIAGSPDTTVNGVRGAGSVLVLERDASSVSLPGLSFIARRLVPTAPKRAGAWGDRVLAAVLGIDLVDDVVVSERPVHRAEVRDVLNEATINLTFTPGVSVGNWAYWGMESADLDGDGQPDVVITANHNKATGCVIGTAFTWLSTVGLATSPLRVQPGATGVALVPRTLDRPGLIIAGDSPANGGSGQLNIYRVN